MYGDEFMNYVFMTDVSCDLTPELAKEINVEVLPMEFEMGDKCYQHFIDCRMMSHEEFYTKQNTGIHAKTSQINYNSFVNYFEPYLKAGKDVIYTGIAGGLSGTFNTCLIAVKELQEKYPDRKIIVIDSCCDSLGLGQLVYLAGKKYVEGASIDELADFINETKTKIVHWFIVQDLDHLKRGGRISAVSATFGKALQIKPLLGVNDDGSLANVGKIRGESNIVNTLVKLYERDAEDSKNNIVFIAHTENPKGVDELKKRIKGTCKEIHILPVGPIIGAHVGSGLLAVTFIGNRNTKY